MDAFVLDMEFAGGVGLFILIYIVNNAYATEF
jgi:hypothetical protein